ncbi:MAG: hydrogenase formation protein HypD [Pirellulales bacterium]|nr:hydrogenase formation protein HypD [Pirellulales bacterium]
MKFQDEYRDPRTADKLRHALADVATRPWTIMEVCGGQTHTIVRYGIDELLPPGIELVHGPGCPVCVTPIELIDQAIAIASQPNVIFCSFGDMLRVPGSTRDLLAVKAAGGDVRIVYSPLDCLRIADQNPRHDVVFFAVGFETTAPANAMAVWQAKRRGLTNFSVLVSHVLVPPAMAAMLSSPSNRVQGVLAAGHVCTVMGYDEYLPLSEQFQIPIVVTGFEPLDLLEGIYRCVRMLEAGRVGVENQYARVVRRAGNPEAIQLVREVFQVCDRKWRGIGTIAQSGLELSPEYEQFDAQRRFTVDGIEVAESNLCISGLILQGLKKPHECPAFGGLCTPEHPLGATMVSSEGACAAYFHYARFRPAPTLPSPSKNSVELTDVSPQSQASHGRNG